MRASSKDLLPTSSLGYWAHDMTANVVVAMTANGATYKIWYRDPDATSEMGA